MAFGSEKQALQSGGLEYIHCRALLRFEGMCTAAVGELKVPGDDVVAAIFAGNSVLGAAGLIHLVASNLQNIYREISRKCLAARLGHTEKTCLPVIGRSRDG